MSRNCNIKKIMFLIVHLSDGGAERVLSELSCHFPDEIEQVIVLFENKVTYTHNGRLICLDVPFTFENVFIRTFRFLKKLYRYRKILKAERPDCSISFGGEANIINILASRVSIVTEHVYISKLPRSIPVMIMNFLIHCLYGRTSVIAVSKGIKKNLVERFGVKEERVHVINNPFDINRIRELSSEKVSDIDFDDKIPTVVTSGRLIKQKGQWHLIRAFSEVRKNIPCRLLVLGDGELAEYLKDLARQLELNNDILFLGWQKNPYKYLSRSDVFVLSSLWEGFGNVLIEAMACGIPVISTDCLSGPREILSQYNGEKRMLDIEYAEYGILVPVCDGTYHKTKAGLTTEEKKMAETIISMLKDKKLQERYSEASSKRCVDFEAEKIVSQYISVIESLTEQPADNHE